MFIFVFNVLLHVHFWIIFSSEQLYFTYTRFFYTWGDLELFTRTYIPLLLKALWRPHICKFPLYISHGLITISLMFTQYLFILYCMPF